MSPGCGGIESFIEDMGGKVIVDECCELVSIGGSEFEWGLRFKDEEDD